MDESHRSRPTIGVLAGWQAYAGTLDTFLENVFRGIQSAAHDLDCNLLLACGVGLERGTGLGRPAWPVPMPEADFVPVGPWNTDGLIVVCPLACEAGIRYFNELAGQFPVVFVGSRETGPAVNIDNDGGIHQALRHLVEHGRQHIAFVAGREHRVQGDSRARLQAYQSGIQALGLPFDPSLIAYGSHTYAGGWQATEELLKRGVHFSAVLASNDESAIGVVDALRVAGRSVPQDVAVIGFDDRPEARALVPPLTTVHLPMFEMGYRAVGFLLERIEGVKCEAELIRVQTHLVIRESCGCSPAAGTRTPIGQVVGQLVAAGAANGSSPCRPSAPGKHQPGDSQVVHSMTAATYHESQRLGLEEVSYLCQRLLEAFQVSLTQRDGTIFAAMIRQVLERVASQGDDLHAWHEALSILRDHGLARLRGSRSAPTRQQAEDMLHQARVAISEVSRGESSRHLIHQAKVADQLGWMTARFLAAQDEPGVFEALAKSMPALGFQQALVAFYEPDAGDPVAWSDLRWLPPQATCPRRFPTCQFPPEGLFPKEKPFRLALLPLVGQPNLSGFIAFEGDQLDLCAVVVRELVAALRGVQLHREVVEARQLADARRQQAEEASRLKSRFLSTVSHELRTPLNLIAGLSDLLLGQSEPVGPEDCRVSRKDLERIYISAQHLDALIRDVLDLAQSDLSQLKLTCEPLDLREVLEPVSAIAEQLAHDKGLVWRIELPEGLPRIWGDRTRLRQVVLNLVNNAVKFTTRGGLTLTAAAEDGKVSVAVSDTGLGIPEHEQDVIFDEFHQSERTTVRGYGGLGLGLAICKRLVELHGGEISAQSSGEEGEGSTFCVLLPALGQAAPPDSIRPLAPSQKVLLLVQSADGGRLLRDHLARQGYDVVVHEIGPGDDWMSGLLLASPDVVLLDLPLASERGWEITKALRDHPAMHDIPILFYTLSGDEGGGSVLEIDYLTKPLATCTLAETLMSRGFLSRENGQPAAEMILVVDDDPAILALHARMLETQLPDCRVVRARNGREALEVIRGQRPSLVLLDLLMPEVDGFAVLEAMRQEGLTHQIPVVVLTGQVLTAEDMARLNRGVVSVLGKEVFTIQETLEHVVAALQRRRRPGSPAQQLVRKAMGYIHTHYAEPISRSGLAMHVGLSERHLDRCFRQEIGLTPMTYLNRYRVRQAKVLLQAGGKGIGEVAMEVGFSSSGYFTRVFRDEVGVSPRAYLRKRPGNSGVPSGGLERDPSDERTGDGPGR